MKDNSKLLFGLLVGAIAGAALAVFISSKAGQEIMDELEDATDSAGKGVRKALDTFEDKFSKGKEFALDLEKKAGKFIKQHTK